MSEQVSDFVWATLWVIAGSAILTNAEALARLDLGSSDKIGSWFKRRLGENSVWNRKIFPVEATSRFRGSKIEVNCVCCFDWVDEDFLNETLKVAVVTLPATNFDAFVKPEDMTHP